MTIAAGTVHFCGRMFGEAHPEEPTLRSQIDTVLHEHRVTTGYGALACGADILVAEALLHQTADLHVILPFDADRFAATSVRIGGPSWTLRYDRCLDGAKTVQVLDINPEHRPFAVASKAAMAAAQAFNADAFQIALFDNVDPDATTGTAADIAYWQSTGGKTVVIKMPPTLRLSNAART